MRNRFFTDAGFNITEPKPHDENETTEDDQTAKARPAPRL
jgi:hypothetical protein